MKIWFNHSFSTTYHFIKLIKNNPDQRKFEIFCTHGNPNSVTLTLGDYNQVEPDVEGIDYIDFCLAFCKKHKIDIFVPGYKRLALISENYQQFNNLGIKILLSDDVEKMSIINDKSKTYEQFKKNKIIAIPEYYIVNTVEQFINAYQKIINNGSDVCLKPLNSQGGFGFRIIDNNSDSLEHLMGTPSVRISFDYACKVLGSEKSFAEIMVCEYLNGFEYSIDCLSYQGKLYAAIPRKKMGDRLRYLEDNQELITIAEQFNESYKLDFIYNIQVRYKDNVPKLLEINPRMSGGLNTSCLSGINFPYLAIKLLFGEKIEVPKPKFGIMASDIEETIIIS
ncbi:MAG: ATP-grasp domain-containing protein [Candidatus Sericytochromatia bacterium]|nr:ATP-grasp domain-containing protein [Candidatus Sericytochromatia bacterium]